MKKRNYSKFVARVTAFILIAISIIWIPKNVEAADAYEDKIVYETVSDAKARYAAKQAPEKAGYVFAGWYTDESTPVQEGGTVEDNTTLAKFVPAYVLSVKAQNGAAVAVNANNEPTVDKGDMRVVSSTDACLDYQAVGFRVYLKNETTRDYTSEGQVVFSKLKAGDNSYTADQVFGKCSKYFITLNLLNIPKANFDDIIYVRPFWKTCDGTEVFGLAKYVHVEDGYKHIINIPINLYTAKQIAAGVVEVTYPEGITYLGYETGRLFEETEVNLDTTTRTVKCAGNVATLANKKADTDIYMNLRFQAEGNYTIGKDAFLTFEVKPIDFCNVLEQAVELTNYIWNIQY